MTSDRARVGGAVQCSAVKARGGGSMGDAGLQAAVVDGLRAHLQRVRVADGSTRVFKEECCITFDTPRSKTGLLVDLNSFLAFSERAAAWQHAKTGNAVFLRIREVEKEKEGKEDEEGEEMDKEPPSKKPTLLAIGVEGGFNPEKEVQYETRYSVVLLPDKLELPYPNNDLPEIVRRLHMAGGVFYQLVQLALAQWSEGSLQAKRILGKSLMGLIPEGVGLGSL
ncbi:unnamed protein product [Closterium sp. NIES-64]|nr:unnamed protein product [Closterium sp. NIES-64]